MVIFNSVENGKWQINLKTATTKMTKTNFKNEKIEIYTAQCERALNIHSKWKEK